MYTVRRKAQLHYCEIVARNEKERRLLRGLTVVKAKRDERLADTWSW